MQDDVPSHGFQLPRIQHVKRPPSSTCRSHDETEASFHTASSADSPLFSLIGPLSQNPDDSNTKSMPQTRNLPCTRFPLGHTSAHTASSSSVATAPDEPVSQIDGTVDLETPPQSIEPARDFHECRSSPPANLGKVRKKDNAVDTKSQGRINVETLPLYHSIPSSQRKVGCGKGVTVGENDISTLNTEATVRHAFMPGRALDLCVKANASISHGSASKGATTEESTMQSYASIAISRQQRSRSSLLPTARKTKVDSQAEQRERLRRTIEWRVASASAMAPKTGIAAESSPLSLYERRWIKVNGDEALSSYSALRIDIPTLASYRYDPVARSSNEVNEAEAKEKIKGTADTSDSIARGYPLLSQDITARRLCWLGETARTINKIGDTHLTNSQSQKNERRLHSLAWLDLEARKLGETRHAWWSPTHRNKLQCCPTPPIPSSAQQQKRIEAMTRIRGSGRMRRRDSTATSNFAFQFQGEQMSSGKCKQIQRRDPKNSQKDFQRLPSSLSHAKAIDAQLVSVSLKGTDHDASVPLHPSDLGEASPSDGLESDRTIYELAGRGFSRDTDLAKELQEATENGFRIFSRPEIKTQADQSFMLGLNSLCDLEKEAILEFLSLSTFSWDNLQESSPSVQAEYTTQSQFEGRKARGGGLVAEPRADGLSREELNEIEEALLDEQRRLHRGLGPHQVRRGFKSTRAHHATFDTVPCSQRPSIKIPSISMVHSRSFRQNGIQALPHPSLAPTTSVIAPLPIGAHPDANVMMHQQTQHQALLAAQSGPGHSEENMRVTSDFGYPSLLKEPISQPFQDGRQGDTSHGRSLDDAALRGTGPRQDRFSGVINQLFRDPTAKFGHLTPVATGCKHPPSSPLPRSMRQLQHHGLEGLFSPSQEELWSASIARVHQHLRQHRLQSDSVVSNSAYDRTLAEGQWSSGLVQARTVAKRGAPGHKSTSAQRQLPSPNTTLVKRCETWPELDPSAHLLNLSQIDISCSFVQQMDITRLEAALIAEFAGHGAQQVRQSPSCIELGLELHPQEAHGSPTTNLQRSVDRPCPLFSNGTSPVASEAKSTASRAETCSNVAGLEQNSYQQQPLQSTGDGDRKSHPIKSHNVLREDRRAGSLRNASPRSSS
ncbi:hypothetical protein FA10DRAFT_36375 [Acaromyces ingoldii]|uniref:Uncharacterized protein n=1 Tax=Acaromyces ingoldii TaxID=215250 RepID=A0A316YYW4_9BASI|nr:hypothetical protein FA10DRAFT_36375 [Acaromyces ingoldii]PWN93944.1 hypothetical protein FA10DRAFT_36375 [Acaromyces ingoldii]